MIKILHNNSCSKSRAALEYLDENGIQFEIIDIIKNPLSELEIRTLLRKLNLEVTEIIRKNDPLYPQYSREAKTEENWVKILGKNPELLQRPILIKGPVAMIGRPLENIRFFIEG